MFCDHNLVKSYAILKITAVRSWEISLQRMLIASTARNYWRRTTFVSIGVKMAKYLQFPMYIRSKYGKSVSDHILTFTIAQFAIYRITTMTINYLRSAWLIKCQFYF